jgi:hypothetical protein
MQMGHTWQRNSTSSEGDGGPGWKKGKAHVVPFSKDEYLMDVVRGIRDQWAKNSAEYRRLNAIFRALERDEGLSKKDIIDFIITAPTPNYPNGKSRLESIVWEVFVPTIESAPLLDLAKALGGNGHWSSDFLIPLAQYAVKLGAQVNVCLYFFLSLYIFQLTIST